MKKIVIGLLWFPFNLLLIIFCFFQLYEINKNQAPYNYYSNLLIAPNNLFVYPTPKLNNNIKDIRITVLENYFQDKSPILANLAEDLVFTADRYGLDYTILPAIAMQESGGCKRIPKDSYNCWGYGIYQDNVIRFNSYEEAIDQIAKIIKLSYINNGLTNPTLVEDKWAPPSRGIWSYAVNFFISQIKDYEKHLPNT